MDEKVVHFDSFACSCPVSTMLLTEGVYFPFVYSCLFCHRLIDHMLLSWLSGKESACQCRRPGFDPWVRNIPGGGHGHPLWYGESHGQRSLVGYSPGGGKRAGHDIATATTRTKSLMQRVFLWPDYLVHAMWTYIFVLSSTHVEVVLSFSGRETFALRFLL